MSNKLMLNGQLQSRADPKQFLLMEGESVLEGDHKGKRERSAALKLGISMKLQNLKDASKGSGSGPLFNSRQLLRSMIIAKSPSQTKGRNRKANASQILPGLSSEGKIKKRGELEIQDALPV